jgi:hypothetical protein
MNLTHKLSQESNGILSNFGQYKKEINQSLARASLESAGIAVALGIGTCTYFYIDSKNREANPAVQFETQDRNTLTIDGQQYKIIKSGNNLGLYPTQETK